MILSDPKNNTSLGSKFVSILANPVFLCLLLAAVTLAVYWPVMRCDFVDYDDPAYFMFNHHVQAGLTLNNVTWSFGTTATGNWHPLTWLSLMLDETLFGKSPAGPHFTNLLLHVANTVLLFLLFRRLTGAVWRSALVAALFALHPLHVESVAWISERKDVLSTFFGLLALWAYARFVQKSEVRSQKSEVENQVSGLRLSTSGYYWLALLFFSLGLMSKPMLVTLPFLMLLLDWWPLQRFTISKLRTTASRLILEKIPFFVLSAISCVVTFIVQQKEGSVVAWVNLSTAGRVENASVSYTRYLGKTFWPFGLANPYPHPGHWELWVVIFSMVLVVGLTVAAVWVGRKCPYVAVGWLWYLGTLFPVIGLVQVGIQSIADRYTYVPLIGVFMILAWGLDEAGANRRLPRQLLVVIALLLLVASGLRTRNQLSYWQNSGTLFNHTLAVTGNNSTAYSALGSYLLRQGRSMEATNYYIKSLQIHPDNPDVIFNLGNALTKLRNRCLTDGTTSVRSGAGSAPEPAVSGLL